MFDFLKRSDNSESPDDSFPNWAEIKNAALEDILPDVFRRHVSDFHTGTTIPNTANTTSAAIVIGLGQAGQVILNGWLKRLQENSASAQNTRSYWLYYDEQNQPELPSIAGRHRQINIQQGGISSISHRSSREVMRACLNQASIYASLKEYLFRDAQSLDEKIRVFIVASVREPIVGIMGDLLQLIALLSDGDAFRSNITVSCILTLDGVTNSSELSDAESFAAVREISRMTFKGVHVMPPAVGEYNGILRREALEFLFIVEPPSAIDLVSQTNTKPVLPFEAGSAEISAEAIYVLMHPAGENIWGDLINCLTAGTTIQRVLQTPIVYSLKNATLYLPLALLRQYAILRLTKAALFGEKIASGEGLL